MDRDFIALLVASALFMLGLVMLGLAIYAEQKYISEAVIDSLVNDEVVLACDKRDNDSIECYFDRWR